MASIDPSTLTPERLAPMLRAWAAGLYAEEAAVDLLIAHRTWLTRRDFLTRLVDVETEAWTPGGIPVPQASIDWDTVAMFTDGGALPASSSETVILRLAASLAGTPMTTRCDLTAHPTPSTAGTSWTLWRTAGAGTGVASPTPSPASCPACRVTAGRGEPWRPGSARAWMPSAARRSTSGSPTNHRRCHRGRPGRCSGCCWPKPAARARRLRPSRSG